MSVQLTNSFKIGVTMRMVGLWIRNLARQRITMNVTILSLLVSSFLGVSGYVAWQTMDNAKTAAATEIHMQHVQTNLEQLVTSVANIQLRLAEVTHLPQQVAALSDRVDARANRIDGWRNVQTIKLEKMAERLERGQ